MTNALTGLCRQAATENTPWIRCRTRHPMSGNAPGDSLWLSIRRTGGRAPDQQGERGQAGDVSLAITPHEHWPR
jgi:hypothetical protein